MGRRRNHHEASLTHELMAGEAGFAAMKAYQDHQRSKGEEVSNPLMKQVLAGVAAPGAIKLVETKGLDFLDGDEGRHRLHDRYRHRLF